MASFVEKIRLANKLSVIAYSGTGGSGADFFAYILCTPDEVRNIRIAHEAGKTHNLFDCGKVLYTEFSSEPTVKAKEFLEKWCIENDASLLN
jgi:hypothetical protein